MSRKESLKRYNDSDKAKATQRKWRFSQKGIETRRKYAMNYPKRASERSCAYTTVHKAVKSGVLARPKKCSKCNKSCKPQAHHTDYQRRLEVSWLCPSCHKLEDLNAK